jgi:DNA-binding SARP family transcriptional activator
MRIKLFGLTQVFNEAGTLVGDLGGTKPRQILEILAVSPGTPVSKERLAERLWDGCPPRSYVGTLESYVCVLRRRLCTPGAGPVAIRTVPGGYVLDSEVAHVDLASSRSLLARARSADPAEAVALTYEALGMVTGELLASEPYADWASDLRQGFRRSLCEACTRASGRALEAEDLEQAIGLAELAVGLDQLAESAWRNLMTALWRSGRRGEALRAFISVRTSMISQLGIEPGADTRGLYLEILQERPTAQGGRQHDHAEVVILMALLRQALQAMPGLRLMPADRALTDSALRLIEFA